MGERTSHSRSCSSWQCNNNSNNGTGGLTQDYFDACFDESHHETNAIRAQTAPCPERSQARIVAPSVDHANLMDQFVRNVPPLPLVVSGSSSCSISGHEYLNKLFVVQDIPEKSKELASLLEKMLWGTLWSWNLLLHALVKAIPVSFCSVARLFFEICVD